MLYVLAIVATFVAGASSLLTLVLLMAGGANSSPQQILFIKVSMLATAVVCVGCTVAAIWLMIARHPWWALVAGIAPLIFCIALIITWHFSEQARLTRLAKDDPWNTSTKQVADK